VNFVIDLNAVRTAWNGETPNHTYDVETGVLLGEIIRICSRLVVSDEVERRYFRLFKELAGGAHQSPRGLNVINLYIKAKQSSKVDITRRSADLPELSDETCIKDEDVEFARLTSASRSILVTFDEPLRDALVKLGVNVALPSEALTRLRREHEQPT
jgi:hypothetical protein